MTSSKTWTKRVGVIVALPIMLGLSGCIIVKETRHSDESGNSSWEQAERDNRAAIANVQAGADIGEVRSRMGTPDFTDTLTRDERFYQVLYYRTHRQHGDGVTTRDECTPLVFMDGKLVGSGELAMQQVR